MNDKAGVQSIKQLGKELKRIHRSVDRVDSDLTLGIEGRDRLLQKMGELIDCLIQISRRYNGLEY